MKQTICLLAILFFSVTLSCVSWVVWLTDSGGDGWNGGTLTLEVNEITVLNNVTVATGYGQSYVFEVKHGDRITTIYTPGSNPEQNYYYIQNHNTEQVYSSGAGGAVPASLAAPLIAEVLNVYTGQIGTDTTTNTFPIWSYYDYTYSQSIYLRSDLPVNLHNKRITKLRYYWNGETIALNSLNWKIYIGHTTRTQFWVQNDWVPYADLTKVFDGNVPIFATEGWIEITLHTPFDYNGVDNLVVAVDESTMLSDSNNGKFRCTESVELRSMMLFSQVVDFDPANLPTDMPANVFRSYFYPNIIFQMDPYIYPPKIETFSTAAIPLGWTQYYSENIANPVWSYWSTSYAGGQPNEMAATYVNATGITRLISPPVKTQGLTTLNVSFNHFFDDYSNGVTAKLQYSPDLINWTDAGWSIMSGSGDQSGYVSVAINTAFEENTYFAWTLDGDHYYFDYWIVDNIVFSQPLIEVQPVSIDIAEVVHLEPFNPMATVKNNGVNPASFDVTCHLGVSGYGYYDIQQVVNLAPGATQQVVFSTMTPNLTLDYFIIVTTHMNNDMIPSNDQIAQDYVCIDLDVQAYADVYHFSNPSLKGMSTFNLRHPELITHLGYPSQTDMMMAGGDWIGNHWYGTEYDDGSLTADNYWKINHNTGVSYLQGETGVPIQGIAYDPETDILYGNSLTHLYTLDRYCGSATLIGPLVNSTWMVSIAYSHYLNRLYGVDIETDKLYRIDVSTGLATEVGPLGIDMNNIQDLAFDRDRGKLFLAGYCFANDTGPRLYYISNGSGKAYKIGNFPEGYLVSAFAIPYTTKIPDVTIHSNGDLTWDPIPNASEYKIYGSDEPYGTFSWLGSTPNASWAEAGFPQMKRFYKVTSVYSFFREEPSDQQIDHTQHREMFLYDKSLNNRLKTDSQTSSLPDKHTSPDKGFPYLK